MTKCTITFAVAIVAASSALAQVDAYGLRSIDQAGRCAAFSFFRECELSEKFLPVLSPNSRSIKFLTKWYRHRFEAKR